MVSDGPNDPIDLAVSTWWPGRRYGTHDGATIGAAGGPSMVVESRPGAGSEIGTEYVSRAAPDSNILLIMSPSFVVLPHVRRLNYDPLTDFVPICELGTFPPLIVVNGDSPYHTLNDFIDAARARPSALTYATVGPDTASQVAFEMLEQAAKVDITLVPFTGYTPAIQALLAHQVTAAQADLATLQGQLQTGTLRARRHCGSAFAGVTQRADGDRVGLQGCRSRVLHRRSSSGEDTASDHKPNYPLVLGRD
ncbi:MAG: tripartite tricarboxylate transporter substrate binding protein [Xanthobacteraceae bacterium]